MNQKLRCKNPKKTLLVFLVIISSSILIYQKILVKSRQQQTQVYSFGAQTSASGNVTFKKVSIVHYTKLYGVRTDSSKKIFNRNLQQICDILDPEDYALGDSVFVSLIDLTRLPSSSNGISYRTSHPSQLWIFHSEESPRNSYRTVQIKDITDLDDWFNLTSTLKPQSDFHVQYRGYRVKPEIGHLLQTKLNYTFQSTLNFSSDIFFKESSIYFNTISSILHQEFLNRQTNLSNLCPYTCNRAIPSQLLPLLSPYLPEIQPPTLNEDIVYIAWFVSNCNTHSRREDFVKNLRSQKGIRIDIYGRCKSIYHSPHTSVQCDNDTSECVKKTLRNYRFYLSFENSKCDSYITEKYWIQGLNGAAVPIVSGAKKEHYQRIAIPNSYIHVDDYQTVEDLARELHRLNRNLSDFRKYLQWTQLYEVSERFQPTPAMDMHSTLCFLGHYQYLHSNKDKHPQVESLMEDIKKIFSLTNVHLPNWNWTTAKTNLIRISQFYNPRINCWDSDYPSIFKQIYNHLFTWWRLL